MFLYLLDGHAIAYRSYYAFINRPLVNSRGEETSAVFGFARTLKTLLEKYDPAYIAVAFDSPEKTFRHEEFAEYKANRKEMPEPLSEQIPLIFELLEAMAIPLFALPGYEADDIIATLARRMEKRLPVRIVSGDKDLLQLITNKVRVLRPGKTGLFDEEVDLEGLEKKNGMTPAQFTDFLALMGDASDNIPGVRGVGEKTARKLIAEYGSLENLFANLSAIGSPSLRKKLEEGRDSAFLSRKLIRLDTEAPLEASLEELARGEPDAGRLGKLLERLEFRDVLEGFLVRPAGDGTTGDVHYVAVTTEEELEDLARELAGLEEFAVDVEASDLDPMRAVLAGISLAWRPGAACYVPVTSSLETDEPTLTPPRQAPGLPCGTVRRHLAPILSDPGIAKIGQNIKYDALVLANAGFELEGISFDTMLASYCLDPARRSHGLDSLAAEFLDHRMIPFKDLFDKRTRRKDIREVPLEAVTRYACEDADMTLRLKEVFVPLLGASRVERLFYEVEMPLAGVLTEMEMTGVKLDLAFLASLAGDIDARLGKIRERIFELAGERFNLNSTPKLREILFDRLGLKPGRKTKTGFSTDVDVLKNLASEHEVPGLLLEYRALAKLKNTYVDSLPKLVNPRTGRVHTSYNQAVTSTGRLSSSNPNLQNIPVRTPEGREIRKAFVAEKEDWILFDADYSQIELRILAHLSGDAALVEAFNEGGDVHRRTAAMIMGTTEEEVTDEMRSRAKTVNFGIIYGMGARGLAQSLGIDFQEAKRFIEQYFEVYPGVKGFIDETIAKAREESAVGTLLGRVRQLPDIALSDGRARSFAERVAVNTPVQGTAADIIKLAMVAISREFKERGLKARMILQVHDELLFELPGDEKEEVEKVVRETMEGAMKLDVPLKVDTGWGKNWLEAHP